MKCMMMVVKIVIMTKSASYRHVGIKMNSEEMYIINVHN